MQTKSSLPALATLLLLLAPAAVLAASFPCAGPARQSQCGAMFAKGKPHVPGMSCAPCQNGMCTAESCPTADCIKVVSACIEDDTGRVSYKIGFNGCRPQEKRRMDWAAFQGVNDLTDNEFINHGWLRDIAKPLKDTSMCANVADGRKSTCCLQTNPNGFDQITLWTTDCNTRAVIWLSDKSFKSCNDAKAAADSSRPLPPYLFGTDGPNFCGAPKGSHGQVCGPYTLDVPDCEKLPSCQPCGKGKVCRKARNKCELPSFWTASCTCPRNPIDTTSKCQFVGEGSKKEGTQKNRICYCPDKGETITTSGSIGA